MAIATLDQYIAAAKQRIRIIKTASRTSVAAMPFSVFDIAGNPGAGTLAGTNTANGGVIVNDATAGCPDIAYSTGVGYLSKIEFGSSVACRMSLFDLIVKMGAISYAAATTTPTADTQPAITQRCPDYPGTGTTYGSRNELWLEVSTAFATGNNWTVQVTYRNQAGVSGQITPALPVLAAAALTQGKMINLPLQSGDTGVQRIEAVTVTNGSTAMTAGAFNVLIMRPIYTNMRCKIANDGDVHDLMRTGMPVVYNDSALFLQIEADSTATGIPEVSIEIASA